MKIGTQLCILILLVIAFFLHAQGRGRLIHMERANVVKIASSLKRGMTEREATQFLTSRGLEPDWDAIGSKPTNLFEIWYLFGSSWTHIENLRVTFKAK